MKLIICITLLLILSACGRGEEYPPVPDQYEYYEPYEELDATPSPEPEPTPEPTPEPIQGIHGLLSVVEYGQNRAYILGSIHIGREEWYPLANIAEEAMERADIFAFEIDLGATGGPCICEDCAHECAAHPDIDECICLLMEMMFFPEGILLDDFLPPEDFESFIEVLGTFPGILLDAVMHMRPTTISEILMYQLAAPMLGLSSEHSIDMYIFNRAQELGRPAVGLTDFNDHIRFVSGMPDEYQIATARYFSDYDTMLAEIEELAYIYETQDIETLASLVQTDLSEAYAAYHAGELSAGGLALSRYWHYTVGNYRSNFFARQIADLLTQTEEPTTFFVTVGIAHLSREINVFHVLREMGFEVVGLY